jgi:thymidylate synthase
MLLGVPHNWIQSWALLLWLCEQTDTFPGKMLWTFGDAHIYREPSHMQVVDQMSWLRRKSSPPPFPRLHYAGQKGSNFAASDFEMIGEIPEPVITVKPKLL